MKWAMKRRVPWKFSNHFDDGRTCWCLKDDDLEDEADDDAADENSTFDWDENEEEDCC